MPITNDVYVSPYFQIVKINIWESGENLHSGKSSKGDLSSHNSTKDVQSKKIGRYEHNNTISPERPISSTKRVHFSKEHELRRPSTVDFDGSKIKKFAEDATPISTDRKKSLDRDHPLLLSPKHQNDGGNHKKHAKEVNLLKMLQPVVDNNDNIKTFNETFGWDQVTLHDLERSLLEEEFVPTPFSSALVLILKYWDYLFIE